MSLPPAKEILAEAEAGGNWLARVLTRLTRVLETLDKHTKQLEAQAAEIINLREIILTLQAREEVLLAGSKAAATRAAAQTMSDLARRIGRIEAGSSAANSPM